MRIHKFVKRNFMEVETKHEDDWWDQLPKKVQDEIDEAIAEVDAGKGIPHEEVLERYRKCFVR